MHPGPYQILVSCHRLDTCASRYCRFSRLHDRADHASHVLASCERKANLSLLALEELSDHLRANTRRTQIVSIAQAIVTQTRLVRRSIHIDNHVAPIFIPIVLLPPTTCIITRHTITYIPHKTSQVLWSSITQSFAGNEH